MEASSPLSPQQPAQRSRQLLQQIANTLGVEIEAFVVDHARHLIHTADDATQWFLALGSEGSPVVRMVTGNSDDIGVEDEPVTQFLVRHLQTPQGQALEALINHLLVTSLR
jgi:hypothetical protein